MNTKNLSVKDFTYELPENKIARYPLKDRDQSKLLQYKAGNISDYHFYQLPDLIQENSLMVFNNTKVIHARLLFNKESGSVIEIFCLEPRDRQYQEAFDTKETCTWTCLIGNVKRWKGEILKKKISVNGSDIILSAELIKRDGQFAEVCLSWDKNQINFGELLFYAGILPLPPYLNRQAEEEDEKGYQTHYAKKEGSVAAPTAGLHFTEEVLKNLEEKIIQKAELTLHVGAGTFMPVKSETLGGHEMHQEAISVTINVLKQISYALKNQKKIIAVGTTSMRTLESIYWYGVKLLLNKTSNAELEVMQWDPYEISPDYTAQEALEAVIKNIEKNESEELFGLTQILIAPGYDFKLVNGLITNFHQPDSTLLLLVSAFIGEDWKKVYHHALANDYRFLSFGDSSLLWRSY